MTENNKTVVIMSGGLDSTTLLYDLIEGGFSPFCLSFNYGQRHSKELQYAKNTCRKLGVEHRTLNLAVSGLTELIATSSLTATGKVIPNDKNDGNVQLPDLPVPEGHYAEDNMKATVVPNRNMIMLSMAAGVLVSQEARYLATAVHAGDHFIYPDCRAEFICDIENTIRSGNWGFIDPQFEMMTPYIKRTKADIAYKAIELGVPFHETWSCYKGGHQHCGKCGTCVERLEAIDQALTRWSMSDHDMYGKVPVDSTMYEDKDFWREAVLNR
jgi:7-cyano-7-deazaguanine synthase